MQHLPWPAIFTVIGALAGLSALATVVGGLFRVSQFSSTVTRFRNAAESWQAQAEAQEHEMAAQAAEIASLQESGAEKDRQIAELQGKVAMMQDMLTGRTALEDLTAKLSDMAEKSAARDTEILALTAGLRGELRAVHETVENVRRAVVRRRPA